MSDYLIISDTHGDHAIMEQIIADYDGQVKAMFYNGDSEFADNDPIFDYLLPVVGNMDFDDGFPDERNYADDEVKIYQTHGHLYNTEFKLDRLRERASQTEAEIVTSGHTHKLGAEMIDGKLFINPGSISLPKGEYSYLGGTYAILTVEPAEFKVQFYTRDEEPVPSLGFTFAR